MWMMKSQKSGEVIQINLDQPYDNPEWVFTQAVFWDAIDLAACLTALPQKSAALTDVGIWAA